MLTYWGNFGAIMTAIHAPSLKKCIWKYSPKCPPFFIPHYLNQCWNIVNWNLRNKLQWNLWRNSCIFFQEKALKNVIWKTTAILSQPQCVKEVGDPEPDCYTSRYYTACRDKITICLCRPSNVKYKHVHTRAQRWGNGSPYLLQGKGDWWT